MNLSREMLLQKLVYLLVFLFPVAAMIIRGWNAYIFSVLVIVGLFSIRRSRVPFHKEERVLLTLFLAAFLIFVTSSLASGWDSLATKALGIELMFLLFIPLYLLIRRYCDSGKWLLRGVVAGAVILGLQSGYEVEYLNRFRGEGVYSPIIYGSFSVLYAFLIIGTFNSQSKNPLYWLVIILSTMMALYGAAYSGSRGAYVAIPLLIMLLVLNRFRDWRGGVIIGAAAVLIAATYYTVPYVQGRTDAAVNNTVNYFWGTDQQQVQAKRTSAGQRFEMWKAALLIARDNPVLGVGRGNFKTAARPYMEEGLIDRHAVDHGHPHNMYLDFLAAYGVGGFILTLSLLIYPVVLFFRKGKTDTNSSIAGLLFSGAYIIFSMFEASTFIKVNFLTTFLVFLAVFFSWHVRNIYADESN